MSLVTAPSPERDASTRFWLMACAAVLLVQILAEYMLGRVWICECGYVKLWEGTVQSEGNSQHIFDWYTPSHIIHGFLFYGLASLLFRGKPLALRLCAALVIEGAWEILENSPIIIDRYRAETISLDYYGDSILNSAMDTLAMTAGFLFAARAPVALTVAIAIFFEVFTGWMIRDNLTLNVLMLVWPLDSVKAWQGGI